MKPGVIRKNTSRVWYDLGNSMQINVGIKFFKKILQALIILAVLLVCAGVAFLTNYNWIEKYAVIITILFVVATTAFLVIKKDRGAVSKHVTEDSAEELALFAELYQNSPVPYIRAKNDGQIIDANAAAVRLFGETDEKIKGRNLFAAISGDEKQASHVAMIPELVRNGSFVNDQEAIFTKSSGEMLWVMLSAFPYAHKSETLVTLIDVTKQKNIDTAKSEFVSLASHQLRTPIASIKWNIELLASPMVGTLTADQKAYVDKIGRSAERMSLLVKDFLDASQLEMGTFATEVVEVSLSDFLDEQLEEFDARIAKQQLKIEKVYPPESVRFQVDSHLLRMTVNNLVSNAVKYTPQSGIVKISYKVLPDKIEIRVRDTGYGIPIDDQAKLFSKFFRAPNVKKKLIEGTGVGLYIVKQAVIMMGGAITFASKEGVGTEFLVVLPHKS